MNISELITNLTADNALAYANDPVSCGEWCKQQLERITIEHSTEGFYLILFTLIGYIILFLTPHIEDEAIRNRVIKAIYWGQIILLVGYLYWVFS